MSQYDEVSPPGWSGTVKAMKKHKEIDNPFALAWYMKKKGDKPHYKPEKKSKKNESNLNFESFSDFVNRKDLNEGKWISKAVKHPGRCTPAPNPDCPKGSPQYNLAMRFKKGEFEHKKKES
jgi:hypothetical protein